LTSLSLVRLSPGGVRSWPDLPVPSVWELKTAPI
jgi:hypothetical protein